MATFCVSFKIKYFKKQLNFKLAMNIMRSFFSHNAKSSQADKTKQNLIKIPERNLGSKSNEFLNVQI